MLKVASCLQTSVASGLALSSKLFQTARPYGLPLRARCGEYPVVLDGSTRSATTKRLQHLFHFSLVTSYLNRDLNCTHAG